MSDLQELFSRDPLKLTREDTDQIIEYYRAQRVNFKKVEKEGKVPKAPKAVKPEKPSGPLNMDALLDDI
jgi:hypothetical protein